MTDMENSTKEIPREDYTLIAQEDLRLISENEKLKEAIEKGDTSELERLLLEKSYAKYLFGDYLKRMVYELYIFPEDDGRKITEIPEDEYIKDIQQIFKENGMKGVGTLQFGGSTRLTPSNLKRWMGMPCYQVSRELVFLFGFGFNMFAEQVEELLTKVIGQAGFDFRSAQETIYYWCLKQNRGYSGLREWQEKYMEIQEEAEEQKESGIYEEKEECAGGARTRYYKEKAVRITDEDGFKEYLRELERIRRDTRNRITARETLNIVVNILWYELSKERRGETKWLELLIEQKEAEGDAQNRTKRTQRDIRTMQKYWREVSLEPLIQSIWQEEDPVAISEKSRKLAPLLPDMWKKRSLQDKLNGESRVRKEDILTGVFLTYAHQLEKQMPYMSGEEKDYMVRVETYVEDVNTYLEQCGMGEFYIVQPYEIFLVLCLLYDKPYSFFLSVWKEKERK
nr:hypothetical protein [Lachnoclostridium phocaeense]